MGNIGEILANLRCFVWILLFFKPPPLARVGLGGRLSVWITTRILTDSRSNDGKEPTTKLPPLKGGGLKKSKYPRAKGEGFKKSNFRSLSY